MINKTALMRSNTNTIQAIPTNIITGFLGAGKTTAILKLLTQKPSNERWAILVNEFGEIGVDGTLMQGQHSEQKGVYIREVPGGCMCCAAGLPMQIALNQLLTRAKPDRLLIEPTGLGHPKEVLGVLSADHYRTVLHIQHCITLVDARKLSDSRYTTHDTFNQQIDMADQIIGHKIDLYSEADKNALIHYVHERRDTTVPIHFAEHGDISVELLYGTSARAVALQTQKQTQANHSHNPNQQVLEELTDTGFIKSTNSGEGYKSVGWRFSPDVVFDQALLIAWLSGLSVERAKGVFITDDGVFGYNLTSDTLTEIELDDCAESRIEIIFADDDSVEEKDLWQCVINNT